MGSRHPDRVTIKDVAATAGVSATTVSHALNGKGRIDPATRDRVLAVVEQLDYRASRAARALRTRRSGTLAFLVPAFERPPAKAQLLSLDLYMNQATAAAQTAFAHDHSLLLIPPVATAPDLDALGLDGGIVCDPCANDVLVGVFDSLELPVVTIERDLGRPEDRWHVRADNEVSTARLLDHLAEAGARRIAMISVDFPIAWTRECVGAYEQWCEDRGVEKLLGAADPHQPGRSAHAVACELLDSEDRPDAIVASDERFPLEVMRAARERGLAIPEDVMVATCIDSHQARETTPPVTAVDIQPAVLGAIAAELLVARLRDQEIEAPRTVPAKLHVRASTAAA